MWHRKWISAPHDDGLQVFWLQTDSLFADIRVPAERSAGGPSLGEIDDAGLRDLATCKGFAGRAELHDDLCTWHRVFDWQPDNGVADIGRVRPEGDLLHEEGVHHEYSEIWQRLTPARAGAFGLALADPTDGRVGFLVSVGDHFIYARGRSNRLRNTASLAVLLEACPDRNAQRALFDAEIAMGSVSRGWEITRSTYPWRAGDRLLDVPQALADEPLVLLERDAEGRPARRQWRVVAREATADGAG